jgi:conjugal transfer/entry exclusion protein
VSESEAVTAEALEARLANLEEYVSTQVTPRFDDVQDQVHGHREDLTDRVDDYFSRTEKQISEMKQNLAQALGELRVRIQEKVQEEIRKVTADEIAESLTKKVLVTRQATREELKNSDNVLKTRPATPAEIRN